MAIRPHTPITPVFDPIGTLARTPSSSQILSCFSALAQALWLMQVSSALESVSTQRRQWNDWSSFTKVPRRKEERSKIKLSQQRTSLTCLGGALLQRRRVHSRPCHRHNLQDALLAQRLPQLKSGWDALTCCVARHDDTQRACVLDGLRRTLAEVYAAGQPDKESILYIQRHGLRYLDRLAWSI